MSRVGKKSIPIPANVEVKVEGQKVAVKGPKGELSQEIQPEIRVEVKGNQVLVSLSEGDSRRLSSTSKLGGRVVSSQTKAFWGLTRAIIANLIKGVIDGYEKKLEISGIGFKAKLEENDLVLQVGFTHPVKISCPSGINFSVEKNVITVSGIDKQLVGEISAKIRRVKPPEPYKGRGIKYLEEVIRRKAGKKVVGITR